MTHKPELSVEPTNVTEFMRSIQLRITEAQFAMLRYETEFTPCTGITAVTKQERRHFANGVMIAPWCSHLKRPKPGDDPLKNGKVRQTGWDFPAAGTHCSVLATTDEFVPIIFLDIEGRFQGVETPYDTPTLAILKEDTLYFGLAVDTLLKNANVPNRQFIWGADWETVPALSLVRGRHIISLTLHNTFDESLEKEAEAFGDIYNVFCAPRDQNGNTKPAKTALQVGLEVADVVTTVNRGFAHGMKTEPLQKDIMAKHLQHLIERIVGINNAGFATLSSELVELSRLLATDFDKGQDRLFSIKKESVDKLPDKVKKKAAGKAIVVSMGRRVPQKQHDVLVESLREVLSQDSTFPVLAVFATVHGDLSSPAILARIRALEAEFPSNVVCEDGQLLYYKELMAAADFNCMPSLYEPHGGAYEGTVVPIARAVDGLAEQICGRNPTGMAKEINDRWHDVNEEPTGFLFREESTHSLSIADQFESLLNGRPYNHVFQAMCDSLAIVLREAVNMRIENTHEYARLVLAVLNKQKGLSWQTNLDGMLALIEQARIRRTVA